MNAPVFIVGGAVTPFIGKFHPDFIWKKHPDFGKRENPTLEQLMRQCLAKTLESTGIAASQINRAFVGNFAGELFSSQGHLGAMLAACHPDLAGIPAMRVEGACASGGLAFMAGVDAIRGGADLVLVLGVEVQTTVGARIGADYLARAAHYERERAIDEFTFPCMFARRARHYFEATDATMEDSAAVVQKAYANANLNPLAHMHFRKLPAEQTLEGPKNPCFLENPEYSKYLRLSDCSPVSDGAAAVVLASERALAAREAKHAIRLLGGAFACAPLGDVKDLSRLATTALAASRAYQSASMGPESVSIAEVHDCFSVTELMMLEALQFTPPGRGFEAIRTGRIALDGELPVNPGGGLIGYGHPVGATGVKQVFEVWKQLHGLAGDYQAGNDPKIGLCANMGGDDRTAVVTIFGRA